MKIFFLVLIFLSAVPVALRAQETVEQYHEKFSASYPIREKQHLEIKAYTEKLADEKIREALEQFQPDFFSMEDYKSSLYPFRKQLGEFFGYPPAKTVKGKTVRFEKAGEDRFSTLYRVWIEVVEDVHAYGIYMVPKKIAGKAPLIVAVHGGGGNPEAICGLDIRVNYHLFGHEAVKRGYIVWAPGLTMLSGYANDPPMPGVSRELLDGQLKKLGGSIIGLEIHKIIESTRVLVSERSEIDAGNIGMTGLSWGGFFTMYTTALCPFIKAAAPSANFRDTETELRKAMDPGSAAPAVYSLKGLGHFQAVGLICPRPCMVQVGEKDELFDLKKAGVEAKRAASFYEKLGIGDRFSFSTHPGGHEYEIESIFDFFGKYLTTAE